MTDADRFRAIRDMLIATTGSFSANAVWAHAKLIGVKGRRSDLLASIQEACGRSEKKGGRRVALTGTATGTHTGTGTGSGTSTGERKKEPKKERETYFNPGETSSLLAPFGLGTAEAATTEALAYLAIRKPRGMTRKQASDFAQKASSAVVLYGPDRFADALRYAMGRGKDEPVAYAAACLAKQGATGTQTMLAVPAATGTGRRPKATSREQLRYAESLGEELA